MKRLVSICVVFRNEEEYLDRCLASVVSQDYHPIEVVAVDSMSTDNSSAIVSRYMRKHHHLSLYNNPRVTSNYGFNLAIERAQGDIIVLLGGHTEIASDFVSRSLHLLPSYPPTSKTTERWYRS